METGQKEIATRAFLFVSFKIWILCQSMQNKILHQWNILIFSKLGVWYLEKQPNLKKWSEIEKKTTFGTYSRKTGKFWNQTFYTGTCPIIVRLQ